jgi:hypothetical protein
MEPTKNNATGRITAALIIGLLVGFTAGVFWEERRSGGPGLQSDSLSKTLQGGIGGDLTIVSTSTASVPVKGTGALPAKNLVVKDQPAGDRVEVEAMDAMETLWVAVREEKDGKVGNILGAQKVFVGSAQKVIVELLRPTISGGAYRVVLYREVGDPAFNYREDVAVEGVKVRFLAQ